MDLKRIVGASALAAGIGVAGLFGTGLGTAAANPGQPCGGPNAAACQQNPGPQNNGPGNNGPGNGPQNNAPVNWQNRGVDQGRQDHQPFNWNGQQVTPMPAGNGHGWGFWFLGVWIPL